MKFVIPAIVSFIVLGTTSAAPIYPITGDSVNCRSGPGTSFKIIKTYPKGKKVNISCQTEGTSVKGYNIWDKTQDGCYVSDYYVKTGKSGYVTKKCTTASCGVPKANAATVALVASFEDFRPNIYKDTNGLPTVGYGHLCKKSRCAEVPYKIPLTKANANKLLASDMGIAEKCITRLLNSKVSLNANEYGALVSWAFNVGCGHAESSTLVRRLNKGEKASRVLPVELIKWINDKNGPLEGLRRRRRAEIALSKKATSAKALPRKC